MESNIAAAEQSALPICSIIIPTKDKLNFLQPCTSSVLASEDSNTFEIIIVDNDSREEATKKYLQSLQKVVNIKVLDWHKPFNFSSINNFAATQCRSEYLCFLNNDIEIEDKKWLHKLLAVATTKGVGAVGCTLLYRDSSIQHAGIALDEKTVAQHIAVGESDDYLSRCGLSLPFAVDAVTAACLVMKKSLFLRLGGFNEDQLAIAFNDVDLCLRLADKGLPVLLHPGVKLIHHESVSRQSDELPANRKRALKEHAFMQFRWRIRLLGRIYSSGIPQQIKKLALKNEKSAASIAGIVREAADLLYLQDNSSCSGSKEMQNRYSTATALSKTQHHFHNLQSSYNKLKAHAERLQHAHELIENSIFWRMTYSLRWLKNTLTRGSKKQASTVNTEPAVSEIKNTAAVVSASHHNEGQQHEKKKLNSTARKALKKFLASPEKLQFPQIDAAKISIILVFYQQPHLSFLCLKSILEFADVSYQLIIVDNNSSADTGKLLDKIQNAVILRNKENLGFVKAVNQAAEVANGEFLLLLNNDALIQRGTLSNALTTINADAGIGAVGAKIKLLDGSMQEAGSIIWSDGACLGYGRGQPPENYEFMFRRDVDYCSAAFLLFRRRIFSELNGFDEDFAPAYYEESDFCIRLQKKGLRIVYEPAVEITHYEFASSGGFEGASKLQAEHRKILCSKHTDFLRKKFANDSGNVLQARTANDYPNILVIDDRVPHPSLGAGYPRCSTLLNELSKMDFNISFYPLVFPREKWSDVYTTLSRNTEVILNSGHDGLQSFLNKRKNFYQYIVVSRVHNMEFFNLCLSLDPDLLGDARIIYDAEAVSAPREILRMEFLGEKLPIEEQQTLIDKELEQSRLAEKIVTVSNNEAEIFARHGYRNTTVLGHAIACSPGAKTFEQRKDLLFVGALRDEDSPNVDSLLWFLINVFPLLEQSIPRIKLHVVGDNSTPSLATIDKENVIFTGRLDSIEAMYDSCRLFIAPTRFAAGIPHKIHEAAAMGLPSVTTALLARQLGWQDGKELLVADTAADYAEQCRRLYKDADLWQGLRDAGLLAISRDCSEEIFRKNLASLFSDSLT